MRLIHRPVLLKETLDALNIDKLAHSKGKGKIIDATLGFGGHSLEILKRGIRVLGIDLDQESLKVAEKRLKKFLFGSKSTNYKSCPIPEYKIRELYTFVHGNFRDIAKIAKENNFTNVDGIFFDLGVTSYQLLNPERGFSFTNPNALLDMRIDPINQAVKASDLLNFLDEKKLIKLFSVVLPYPKSLRLAKAVVERRLDKSFSKVSDILDIVRGKKGRLHPATKIFLALRIAVNSELYNLEEALPQALDLLKRGGRLVLISFHSGEDRIVKNFFKRKEEEGEGMVITKKPIVPKENEIRKNFRSRSARLRVLEKI